MSAPSPAPGWYADPLGDPNRIRYWDGEIWTDHYRDSSTVTQGPPRNLEWMAWLAVAGLVLVAVTDLLAMLAYVNYRSATQEVLDGLTFPFTRVQSALDRVDGAEKAALAGFFIAALTFLPWFHRAYSNLPRLGVSKLRHSTGWAIGAWFVPFLNLIRPKQIADDIFRGSQSEARETGDPTSLPTPGLLHWWWGLLLASGIGARIGASMVNSANEGPFSSPQAVVAAIDQERDGIMVAAVAAGLSVVAATLAVMIVLRVTKAQRDAGERSVLPAVVPKATTTPAGATTGSQVEGSQGPPGWSNPW